MADVFGDAWRRVRLHAPDAPFALVKEWTQHAYEDLVNRRPWQFTKVAGILSVPAARTSTATFTLGSTTVTGVFLQTDVGLQIRLAAATIPIYTIVGVAQDGLSATLDLPYADPATTGLQAVQLIGLYQTLPADFGAFLLVTDPYNQRLFSWWHTQEELGIYDPSRRSTDGNPRALVSRGLSVVPATVGQVQYEWPTVRIGPGPRRRKTRTSTRNWGSR